MDNFIITVARGFGSGGKETAVKIAEELGINCYENRILTLASQLSGYDESKFLEADEKLKGGFLSQALRSLPMSKSPIPKLDTFASDSTLYDFQVKIIKQLAQTESCVIVGKCADYILKDYPNVISIYIEAPRPYCRARIMKKMNIGPDEADRLISRTDRYRADYYRFYTDGNYWTNPVNYDLTFNIERVGQEKVIQIVKEYVKIKFKDNTVK